MKHEEIFWQGVTQPRGPWYEHCSFDPVPTPTGLPNYLFQVAMFDVENKKQLTNFEIFLHPDDVLWGHILSHPTWHKDPRPFCLECIHQILWRLKIISMGHDGPFTMQTGIQFIQGGSLHMTIKAHVLYDSGGVTFLHVVNYANTHVMDQMRSVYEQNPSAIPTAERIVRVRDEFFAKLDEEKKQAQQQQAQNLSNRQLTGSQVSVFADESGDIGFRELANVYVLSAIVIDTSKVTSLRQALFRIIDTNWPSTKPSELHMKNVPESKISHVTSALATCFIDYDIRCLTFSAPKTGFLHYLLRCEAEHRRMEESPIITHWPDILAISSSSVGALLLCLLLEEVITHLGSEALDTGSSMDICHDRKYRKWMNRVLETGFSRSHESIRTFSSAYFGSPLLPQMTFRVEDSATEPCLWLSDWISWELGRWFRNVDFSPDFEMCSSRIRFISFDDFGRKAACSRPGTVSDHDFPDWPRDIGGTIEALATTPNNTTGQ